MDKSLEGQIGYTKPENVFKTKIGSEHIPAYGALLMLGSGTDIIPKPLPIEGRIYAREEFKNNKSNLRPFTIDKTDKAFIIRSTNSNYPFVKNQKNKK